MKTLGLVVLAQTPRYDFTPEFLSLLPQGVSYREKGCLDGLSLEEILKLKPTGQSETLVSMLNDGTQVVLDAQMMHRRILDQIDAFQNEGIQVIMVVCTGEFQVENPRSIILLASEMLDTYVKEKAAGKKIGVITPLKEQVPMIIHKWENAGFCDIITDSASPYQEVGYIIEAARRIQNKGAQCIILDCMGYTVYMEQAIQKKLGLTSFWQEELVQRLSLEIYSLKSGV